MVSLLTFLFFASPPIAEYIREMLLPEQIVHYALAIALALLFLLILYYTM